MRETTPHHFQLSKSKFDVGRQIQKRYFQICDLQRQKWDARQGHN